MNIKTKSYVHDHIVDEHNHQNLKPDTIYTVIGIASDHYRVIDENGEPILYPKDLFTVVDSRIPSSWNHDVCDDEYYINPPLLSKPGFYEDFFDRKPYALEILHNYLIENEIVTEEDWKAFYKRFSLQK